MKRFNEKRHQEKLGQRRKDGTKSLSPVSNLLDAPGTQTGEFILTAKPRRALFDYAAADVDEIDLTKGDVLEGLTNIGGGWATGKNTSTDRWGTFPLSFIEGGCHAVG